MPELAEVEYYRKRWDLGLGQTIQRVATHPRAKVYRAEAAEHFQALVGQRLLQSAAAAKQMLFRFSGDLAVGLHLGMSGELRAEPGQAALGRHDHLALFGEGFTLLFRDPRMFGLLRWHTGPEEPRWWAELPPPILSPSFTLRALATYLQRHARAPLKACLLDQSRFPGIGNWMADEVLWRAGLHPGLPAGQVTPAQARTLHRELRWVCRAALRTIGRTLEDPPASWLFPHRWKDGGTCPRTGARLERATWGGRTTCWSPARQVLPPSP